MSLGTGSNSSTSSGTRTRRPMFVQKLIGGWKLYLFVMVMLWFFKQSGHIVGELLYYGTIMLSLAFIGIYIRSIADSMERC